MGVTRRVVSWAHSQGVTVTQWVLTEWNPLKVPNVQKMPLELRKLGDRQRGPELTRPFLPPIDWPLEADRVETKKARFLANSGVKKKQ